MLKICDVCGSQDLSSHDYRHWGWPELDLFNCKQILTCNNCGFSKIDNSPNENELNDFYQNHYRKLGSPFYIPYDKRVKITKYPMRAISQIALSKCFCNFNSGDYILDIGSGYGDILTAARKILINPKLAVIELAKGAIDFFKRNYDVEVFGSLEDFYMQHKAKIIILSHCLEHFRSEDLPTLFDDLKSSMRSDGVIMIEVPHVDMRIHSQLRYPDTPHLLFFSKLSLIKLIEKYGFELCYLQLTGASYPYKFKLPNICSINHEMNYINFKDFLRNLIMSRIYGRKIISIYRNIRKINFRESPDVYGEFCDVDNGDVLRIIIKKKQRKSYEL